METSLPSSVDLISIGGCSRTEAQKGATQMLENVKHNCSYLFTATGGTLKASLLDHKYHKVAICSFGLLKVYIKKHRIILSLSR